MADDEPEFSDPSLHPEAEPVPLPAPVFPDAIDGEGLTAKVEDLIKLHAGRLLSGAAEDLERFARELAPDFAYAAAVGGEKGEKLREHLRGSISTLGARHKLTAKREAFSFLIKGLDLLSDGIGAGVVAAQ